jgi:hypothetical protein
MTYTALDLAGNQSACTVTVLVPHDKKDLTDLHKESDKAGANQKANELRQDGKDQPGNVMR